MLGATRNLKAPLMKITTYDFECKQPIEQHIAITSLCSF